MDVTRFLFFIIFLSEAKACSRQIKVKNLQINRCDIPHQLTSRCMQLRELCGFGVSQLDNYIVCDTADMVCDEARKMLQHCYSSIVQLNAYSNIAASDKDAIDELTKNRYIVGSNRTVKLITENELQTHLAKMRQIANLSANFNASNFAGILYDGDIWLTDPQADIIIRSIRQFAESITPQAPSNSTVTVSIAAASSTSSTATKLSPGSASANISQNGANNAVSPAATSANIGTTTAGSLNAASTSSTTKTTASGTSANGRQNNGGGAASSSSAANANTDASSTTASAKTGVTAGGLTSQSGGSIAGLTSSAARSGSASGSLAVTATAASGGASMQSNMQLGSATAAGQTSNNTGRTNTAASAGGGVPSDSGSSKQSVTGNAANPSSPAGQTKAVGSGGGSGATSTAGTTKQSATGNAVNSSPSAGQMSNNAGTTKTAVGGSGGEATSSAGTTKQSITGNAANPSPTANPSNSATSNKATNSNQQNNPSPVNSAAITGSGGSTTSKSNAAGLPINSAQPGNVGQATNAPAGTLAGPNASTAKAASNTVTAIAPSGTGATKVSMYDYLTDGVGSSRGVPVTAATSKTSSVAKMKRKKRQIIASNPDWSWDAKQPIRYLIDAELATYSKVANEIHEAFEFWEIHTCLTFVEGVADEDSNFIFVANGPFIFAESGKKGFAEATQKHTKISLPAASINFGTILHAIGHALGLLHAQDRPDSEKFVVFNENEGNPLYENFPCPTEICKKINFFPFDFGSNFQLGTDFLLPRDRNFNSAVGQKHFGPTFYDVKIVNDFYCPAIQCNSNLNCWNGGYSHPKLCGECLCPAGFTGSFCNETLPGEPAECGGNLIADDSWRPLESPNLAFTDTLDPSQECTWLIESPNGTIIQLQFADNTFGFPAYTDPTTGRYVCDWNHVELRLQADLANTGYRFCGKARPADVFESATNRAMVLLRAPKDPDDRRESEGFQLLFRFAEN